MRGIRLERAPNAGREATFHRPPRSAILPLVRQIGRRAFRLPALAPSADALRAAAIHQETGQALAAVATTGIRKSIYRLASHPEMNRATERALAHAVALNVRRRAKRP